MHLVARAHALSSCATSRLPAQYSFQLVESGMQLAVGVLL